MLCLSATRRHRSFEDNGKQYHCPHGDGCDPRFLRIRQMNDTSDRDDEVGPRLLQLVVLASRDRRGRTHRRFPLPIFFAVRDVPSLLSVQELSKAVCSGVSSVMFIILYLLYTG